MKTRILLIGLFVTMFAMVASATVVRYFIGDKQISESDFRAIDTSLVRAGEVWTHDDVTDYVVHLDVHARIDTTSVPGCVLVVMRSPEEIEAIEAVLQQQRSQAAIFKDGDMIPDFVLFKLTDGEPLSLNQLRGKVILLNFWATWCGPCLQELKSEYIPAVVAEFAQDDNFVFLPVSVNHDQEELDDFFSLPEHAEFSWLREATLWDLNRDISDELSTGGIPLTILIDADNIIRMNESGAILTEAQLAELRRCIASCLD